MKTALVTGSGKHRIGKAIAESLAAHGFNIALHYRSSRAEAEETQKKLNESGVRCAAFQADLTSTEELNMLMDRVLAAFGRIDVLVTAHSIYPSIPFTAVTAEDLEKHFDVEIKSTFLCCQRAGVQMAQREEGGAIITIGDWAVTRPYRRYSAYFATKGALPTLTRALAVELAALNPNVRVNCVMPGPVCPPEDMPEQEKRELAEATLVGRLGRPEHVAHAVLFLVQNDFVTGVSLPVDGGRSITC